MGKRALLPGLLPATPDPAPGPTEKTSSPSEPSSTAAATTTTTTTTTSIPATTLPPSTSSVKPSSSSVPPTSTKPSSTLTSSSVPTIAPSTSIVLTTGNPSSSLTSATATATASPETGDQSFPTGMVAGVCAVIFAVAISLAGFVFYTRYKKRKQEKAWAMQELFNGTSDDPSILASDPIYRDGEADNMPLPKNWNDPYSQPYSPRQPQQQYMFYQQTGAPQSPFPNRAPGPQPSYHY
ncbi:hypothetical protein BC943DRAFT_321126 [Umbelopsis sp. AD052]|nr:hypothetical protein BC943DRAFT_321126 [Umbelopsis sp. AD052]